MHTKVVVFVLVIVLCAQYFFEVSAFKTSAVYEKYTVC